MTIHARDAAQNTIGAVYVRDGSNVLATLGAVRVRDTTGLYDLLNTFKATGPDEVDGFGYSAKSIQITTSNAAITASGGTAPYTYSWSVGAGWSVLSPGSSTTAFRSPLITPNDSASTTATCTVTDANGNTATVNVLAVCSNYS